MIRGTVCPATVWVTCEKSLILTCRAKVAPPSVETATTAAPSCSGESLGAVGYVCMKPTYTTSLGPEVSTASPVTPESAGASPFLPRLLSTTTVDQVLPRSVDRVRRILECPLDPPSPFPYPPNA